jgi:hypothetical protein
MQRVADGVVVVTGIREDLPVKGPDFAPEKNIYK